MFENREEIKVPRVMFRARRDHEWVDVMSNEVFAGKTLVVFSLTGGTAPTGENS
jgi:peroxiredoxin